MSQDPQIAAPDAKARLPRVALMGEFSAGKSTLTNLLLGGATLPVRITATRLPPVWITHGEGDGLREDTQGEIHPLDARGLDGISIDDTRLIQMRMQSDILNLCDLVDMPGISDPNMDSQVWRGVIEEADLVIWCTHATQAWRQSEAAAFDSLPAHLQNNAILLITQFDKLLSERDKSRVLKRVSAETKGRFSQIFPISLLEAVSAGSDRARWDASGAEAFVKALLQRLTKAPAAARGPERPTPQGGAVRPTRVKPVAKPAQRPEPTQADRPSHHA